MKEVIIFICIATFIANILPQNDLRFLILILGSFLFSVIPFIIYIVYIVPFILPLRK
jgi:hypothetical protein